MIDPKEHGIEEGDRIRITVEGVVEKGDLYDPYDLHVGGIALRQLPISVPIEPTVEILEKAEPKWHNAQVIRASTRFAREIFMRREGLTTRCHWVNSRGQFYVADDLLDVEVIVQ